MQAFEETLDITRNAPPLPVLKTAARRETIPERAAIFTGCPSSYQVHGVGGPRLRSDVLYSILTIQAILQRALPRRHSLVALLESSSRSGGTQPKKGIPDEKADEWPISWEEPDTHRVQSL